MQLRTMHRWAVAACGLAVLIWMSLEDRNSLFPTLLGGVIAALVVWGQQRRLKFTSSNVRIVAGGFIGAIGGAGAALIATVLMLLKTGWHGHLVPDFSFEMMLAMISRAPAWAIAGALVMIGVMLLISRPQSPPHVL